jgi:hypothetical protein
MRAYRSYTDEDIINYAKEVKSISALLDKLKLRKAGGNFNNIKRNLQRLNVNTDHWTGQGWNKDAKLKDWDQYTRGSTLKPHLIKERGHKCEHCNLEEWMGQMIPIELDHIDGDRTNNKIENLRLLCANCHSLTPTFRNRKRDVV